MLRSLTRWMSPEPAAASFSQSGEDRIVKWVLDVLGIERPRYLDIGAHHPRRLNNTYLSYTLGGSGVLVEPNPHWSALQRRERPRDVCLNLGVAGGGSSSLPFYVMRSDTLCTFSQAEAFRMVAECEEEILEVKPIPVATPATLQSEHFGDGLNYVSLDVEGLELEILRAFDFEANRPEVFCIETLSYAIDGTGVKAEGLIRLMESAGYVVHADTHINTIFVDAKRARSFRR